MSDETKITQEDKEYLEGSPTRMEVSSYINGLLEDKYMPEVMKNILKVQGAMSLGFMVLQAILIKNNITTGEEIEQITKDFIAKQDEENSEKPEENK